MQTFYLVVNGVIVITLLGLSFAALIKSSKISLNRVFSLFTWTVALWIIAAYTSNDVNFPPHFSVVGNYLVFLFSYISGYLLLWFAIVLSEDKKVERYLRKSIVPVVVIGAISATPLVVAGVKRQGGVYAVEFGPLVLLYFASLLLALSAALLVLQKNIKKTDGERKSHLLILYRSMFVALPLLLVAEFILPAITGWFGLTNVGILFMAIPVVGLYYSVVKFKLFNLRLAIVRSLGYVLAISIIAIAYGLASYYVTTLTQKTHDTLLQAVLNILLIIVAINLYPVTKRTFQKLTNRLFYRDAYEPQELYDHINRSLVSTIDLNKLLKQISDTVVVNIKTDFCLFDIEATEHSARRVVGSDNYDLKYEDLTSIRDLETSSHRRVIAVDNLDEKYNEIRNGLENIGISVLIKLIRLNSRGTLGYMLIGPKSSGNPYSDEDLRVLDTIANELVIAIQNSIHYEEIQAFNITLQTKVNEATSKLRRANEKLRTLDETKDDFISMASHQLRTPLTSVKGYISMVLEGDVGKITNTQKEMLNQAFFSSQRMVYLIADLLNVSRLKTGKFIIEPGLINLADVVGQELSQVYETAAAKNQKLIYDKPKDFPTLTLDETKTRQVIMNFVDNAIYYTQAGGQISVKLIDNPQTIELRVEDNGIGVPKAEQHHLFTKFYRAGNARKARPDGTGLGLFMAKKVIAAEGGSIIFESEEGKGSTFGFVFSKAKLAPKTNQPAPNTKPTEEMATV